MTHVLGPMERDRWPQGSTSYPVPMEDADRLIAQIVEWGKRDPRVTAVVLTGSRGRNERVDQFSDIDGERWRGRVRTRTAVPHAMTGAPTSLSVSVEPSTSTTAWPNTTTSSGGVTLKSFPVRGTVVGGR